MIDSRNDRYSRMIDVPEMIETQDMIDVPKMIDTLEMNDKGICNCCADCGTDCEVPFVPKHDRPVYCSDCFRQKNQETLMMIDSQEMIENQDIRDDRYSRNDRQRNDRRMIDVLQEMNHVQKTQKRQIPKKQESFYSNGSDKFYESLKEKLFEILGGKFVLAVDSEMKEPWDLVINYDDEAFDDIQKRWCCIIVGKIHFRTRTCKRRTQGSLFEL